MTGVLGWIYLLRECVFKCSATVLGRYILYSIYRYILERCTPSRRTKSKLFTIFMSPLQTSSVSGGLLLRSRALHQRSQYPRKGPRQDCRPGQRPPHVPLPCKYFRDFFSLVHRFRAIRDCFLLSKQTKWFNLENMDGMFVFFNIF